MGLASLLPEGGYLFLGDAEPMHMFSEAVRKFDFIESGNAIFYKKRGEHTQ
jgi:chemotaxis methyl-accepting protein methylase